MTSLSRMTRKKILRKLPGKSFSEKYNFKRLLQTTPDLSKLYTKHEDAVNSIYPIRQIPIFDHQDLVFHPDVQPPDVCEMEIFGPGSGDWPSRIKYAEQILDLYDTGETAWVVTISRKHRVGVETDNVTEVKILEYKRPTITIHYPIFSDRPNNYSPIFNEKKLAKIDQNDYASYFLVSQGEILPPTNLIECGLIPNGFEIYNTTFHHKGIALLYADSLREIIKHF